MTHEMKWPDAAPWVYRGKRYGVSVWSREVKERDVTNEELKTPPDDDPLTPDPELLRLLREAADTGGRMTWRKDPDGIRFFLGETVRLEIAGRLPRALWERLKRYVDVLEPPE